ncbi:hypothetical protein F4775DRAFT_284693 [Biscogniauxia sp. FL1348]|nr:hypothetical protein F4775DRAFT_284693 [Biscogniauxia sp. FL1348]
MRLPLPLPLPLPRPRLPPPSSSPSPTPFLPRHPHARPQSTSTTTSTSTTSTTTTTPSTPRARLSRLLTRTSSFLPRRLHAPLSRLRSAPLSHVGAFLALHEVTAVVPVVGLAWGFHALDWVPWVWGGGEGEGEEAGGVVVKGEEQGQEQEQEEKEKDKGLARWERYFRRKGWFGLGEVVEVEAEAEAGGTTAVVSRENREKAYRIGMQIAAAYAITKMLLVPRIALSLWLTPSLARGFVSFRQAIWRKRS